MSDSSPLNILLGVSASIAAYKAVLLTRLLTQAGHQVQVVMTKNAGHLIAPLAFQAICGRAVRSEVFDAAAEDAMDHISLARWADLFIVAPATASLLSRMSQGSADDLLTTLALATRAPIMVSPAMNPDMWSHPATQHNVATLRDRGVMLLEPATGDHACGETGQGRMQEPEEILAAVEAWQQQRGLAQSLAGRRVLITAGPTEEALDPVRVLTNHSSGKMGYAVANAAARAGAQVTLVSGPVSLPTPAGVERVNVRSAREMQSAVMDRVASCDVFIGTAAVADFRPADVSEQKIKKGNDGTMTLTLVPNPDIIAGVAAHALRPFVVGFAAETEKLVEHARDKIRRKNLDLICANDVSDGVFGSDSNHVLLIDRAGNTTDLGQRSKAEIAIALIAEIAQRLETR